jgi:hypothetical protein
MSSGGWGCQQRGNALDSPLKMPALAGMRANCQLTCLGAFLHVCRVVFEQCCSCWERLNTRAMALLPSATGQGTAEGRRKKKKQELQLDSQGQPDWDEEQVSQAILPFFPSFCRDWDSVSTVLLWAGTLCLAGKLPIHNQVPNKRLLLTHMLLPCQKAQASALCAH